MAPRPETLEKVRQARKMAASRQYKYLTEIAAELDIDPQTLANYGVAMGEYGASLASGSNLPDLLSEHGGTWAPLPRMPRTPWGEPDIVEPLAPGVMRVHTPGHGGLRIEPEQWDGLPLEVRATFMNPGWAEEDCEMPIAMVLLDLGSEPYFDWARKTVRAYDGYAPCAPFIEAKAAEEASS